MHQKWMCGLGVDPSAAWELTHLRPGSWPICRLGVDPSAAWELTHLPPGSCPFAAWQLTRLRPGSCPSVAWSLPVCGPAKHHQIVAEQKEHNAPIAVQIRRAQRVAFRHPSLNSICGIRKSCSRQSEPTKIHVRSISSVKRTNCSTQRAAASTAAHNNLQTRLHATCREPAPQHALHGCSTKENIRTLLSQPEQRAVDQRHRKTIQCKESANTNRRSFNLKSELYNQILRERHVSRYHAKRTPRFSKRVVEHDSTASNYERWTDHLICLVSYDHCSPCRHCKSESKSSNNRCYGL